jgi:hypothetical protein
MDADSDLELVYTSGRSVHAWNIDGTYVPGWPKTTTYYPDGAPAYGDIDGDGIGDVVVSGRSAGTGNAGQLYAWDLDGTLKSGFPVVLGGGATKTPTLADLDADGALEIIVEERAWPTGYVGVYFGDGSVYPGWPQQLDYVPGSAAAVGDITGDGVPEIVAESYYSVYAYDRSGQILWIFTPGNDRVFSYSSPVLADLDDDGQREVICGDHSTTVGNGRVHVLYGNDGSIFPGWPRDTSYWIYGPVAVGDIDLDGNPDLAVGDQVLSGSPVNRVYGWRADGSSLTGFPINAVWAVNCQIILADLDSDGQVELMFDDNTGSNQYMGYNHDGTPMDGWPLTMQGTSFFNNPFAFDMNHDGLLDLSGAGGVGTSGAYFYLWNANATYAPELSFLPVLQYNSRHDGVYEPLPSTGVDAELAPPEPGFAYAAPNPFRHQTAITFSADAAVPVRLAIHSVNGRRVKTLLVSDSGSGDRTATWDGRDERGRELAPGVYWWTLAIGERVTTRSVVLSR